MTHILFIDKRFIYVAKLDVLKFKKKCYIS